MRAMLTIFRREFAAYTRSPIGWVVAAAALFAIGLLYIILGNKTSLASEKMTQFFFSAGGTGMVLALILSFRVIAEDRQSGSMILLSTSPVRETAIVFGKFLGALGFFTLILFLSLYIPLLIKGTGKITGMQIFVGYLGSWLLGATCLAIGVFASSLTKEQIIAALVGALLLFIGGYGLLELSRSLDPPLRDAASELGLWGRFQAGFMRGIFNLKDLVYYLAMTYFFLLLSVKTLEAKRWQ
jgi:ABC-2 type transport system permease protein